MSLRTPCTSTCLPYFIEFSYGFVVYEPLKHESIEDVLNEADSAMYKNKEFKRQSRQIPDALVSTSKEALINSIMDHRARGIVDMDERQSVTAVADDRHGVFGEARYYPFSHNRK